MSDRSRRWLRLGGKVALGLLVVSGWLMLTRAEPADEKSDGVRFVQVVFQRRSDGGRTTTGDLEPHANPKGDQWSPALGGGDRFFPDAANGETRGMARNVVEVRAYMVDTKSIGKTVYFRSFDVDDPSDDKEFIDKNGAAG